METQTPTRLVIVRHGEAQCSVDSVVGGIKGCSGLSRDGRTQAERLRDRLLATGELSAGAAVLTSTLSRAIETAEIIAPGLGPAGDAPAKREAELCELLPGEADGLTWAVYAERYGQVDMRQNPYLPIAPGGESVAEFIVRIGRALTRLVTDHAGDTVVVVAHGGVIWGSMSLFLNLPLRTPALFAPENTSLTEWRISRDRHELVRYNDAAHLTS
jgi:probable phosphoglycerate mutase